MGVGVVGSPRKAQLAVADRGVYRGSVADRGRDRRSVAYWRMDRGLGGVPWDGQVIGGRL